MTSTWVILILALLVASLAMLVAMVPLSLELIERSLDARHHRRRIAAMGPIGRLSARLVVNAENPAQFWTALYAITWIILLAVFGCVVMLSEPQERVKNALVCLLMPVAWLSVQFAIIAFARAIIRTNRRSAPASLDDIEERDEPEDPQEAPAHSGGPVASATDDLRLASPPRSRIGNSLRLLRNLAIVFAIIIIAGLIPGLRELHLLIKTHNTMLMSTTISLAALGFILFMYGCISLVISRGQRMSQKEIDAMQAEMRLARRPPAAGKYVYRTLGKSHGSEARDHWTLAEMKAAFRAGLWLRSRTWRRRYITFTGVMFMTLGLFALLFVMGPEWVMLLCALLLSYALARTIWAFWRA